MPVRNAIAMEIQGMACPRIFWAMIILSIMLPNIIKIVMTAKMLLNGKPTLVQLLTIEFVGSGKGTDLILTNQGTFLEWEGGPEMIEAGWRALLDRLQNYLAQ